MENESSFKKKNYKQKEILNVAVSLILGAPNLAWNFRETCILILFWLSIDPNQYFVFLE